MALKIYLAGPEVFLAADVREEVFRRKREIAAARGFEGVSPLDGEPGPVDPKGSTPAQLGLQISQRNESLMRACDLIVANMTPFRGPSMDVGTAFELGFMRALGKPTLGYTHSTSLFFDRTHEHFELSREGEAWRDERKLQVENFDLGDNLMLDGAIISSGFEVVRNDVPPHEWYVDVAGFAECVEQAAAWARGSRDER